jgi:hypothetical protein
VAGRRNPPLADMSTMFGRPRSANQVITTNYGCTYGHRLPRNVALESSSCDPHTLLSSSCSQSLRISAGGLQGVLRLGTSVLAEPLWLLPVPCRGDLLAE